MTMLAPHLGKEHTLYVDNWYSSLTLFQHLLSNLPTASSSSPFPHPPHSLLGKVITYQKYRENLMRELLEEYHTPRRPSTGGRHSADNPLRLTAWYFPCEVPQTAAQGSHTRRHCKICLSGTRSRGGSQSTCV